MATDKKKKAKVSAVNPDLIYDNYPTEDFDTVYNDSTDISQKMTDSKSKAEYDYWTSIRRGREAKKRSDGAWDESWLSTDQMVANDATRVFGNPMPTGKSIKEEMYGDEDPLVRNYKDANRYADEQYGKMRDNVNANYEDARRNAYSDYTINKKNLPKVLEIGGLTGGASESTIAKTVNAYGQQLYNAELNRTKDLNTLDANIAGQKIQRADALANAVLQADTTEKVAAYEAQTEANKLKFQYDQLNANTALDYYKTDANNALGYYQTDANNAYKYYDTNSKAQQYYSGLAQDNEQFYAGMENNNAQFNAKQAQEWEKYKADLRLKYDILDVDIAKANEASAEFYYEMAMKYPDIAQENAYDTFPMKPEDVVATSIKNSSKSVTDPDTGMTETVKDPETAKKNVIQAITGYDLSPEYLMELLSIAALYGIEFSENEVNTLYKKINGRKGISEEEYMEDVYNIYSDYLEKNIRDINDNQNDKLAYVEDILN